MELKTVKIQSGKGDYAIINESDFNPKEHKLFEEKTGSGDGKMTKADLAEALEAKGIAFDPKATKDELQKLLDAAPTQ